MRFIFIIFFSIGLLLSSTFMPRVEAQKPAKQTKKAYFGGGCFWCMEPPYDKLPGVISTTSGYMGGQSENPTYKQVSTGQTGHVEVLEVEYDESLVSYEKLLEVFWQNIDPFDSRGQFCDKGPQYKSVVFATTDIEKQHFTKSKKNIEVRLAELKKAELAEVLNKPLSEIKNDTKKMSIDVATEMRDATRFTKAEEEHQNYYQNNPIRYKYYRSRCGRDQRLKQLGPIFKIEKAKTINKDLTS